MNTVQQRNREVLAAVRLRRDDLYEAIIGLERALGTPSGGAAVAWAVMLEPSVAHLEQVLDAHVHGTEGEDGLFEQLREEAPRLLPAVERLQAEHGGLVAAGHVLAAKLATVHDTADVDDVRDEALDLMRRLLEHRHRGAELLFDAYQVDVASGD
jgi:hypothetical protein